MSGTRRRLFSAEAVRTARETLETLEKSTGTPVLIETIETPEGRADRRGRVPTGQALGHAGGLRPPRRKETKLEVLPRAATPRRCRCRREPGCARPSSTSFRKKNFDQGLRKGIAALEAELAVAKREQKLPQAEQPPARDESGRACPLQAGSAGPASPTVRAPTPERFPGTSAGRRRAPGDPQPGSPDPGRSTDDHRRRRGAGRVDEPEGQHRGRG